MKTLAILFWTAVGQLAQAQDVTGIQLAPVVVYVHVGVNDSNLRLPCAENIASGIFDEAGIHIDWKTGEPGNSAELPVRIDISSNTPVAFHAGALAYALPFEGEHIRIFWDRVKGTTSDMLVTKVLAHVMAHEITHNLEGIDYHSQTGIMKAHWTDGDLAELTFHQLSFGSKDVALIYAGLARSRRTLSLTKASVPVPEPLPAFSISR